MIKPSKIKLHKQSKTLELAFGSENYLLPAEFLRVHSPSAEVRGHGPGQEVLVSGKINVGINTVKPSGNYGLQIIFDDGHSSGIFSWQYLQELSQNRESFWQSYLKKLAQAQKSRDPETTIIEFK